MRRLFVVLAALAGAAAAFAGCNDDAPLDRVDPNAFFTPRMLDFGSRTIGDHSLPVTLSYSGGDSRQIRDVVFDPAPPDDAFAAPGTRGKFLSGRMPVEIEVLYSPRVEGPHDTTMIVAFAETEARLPITASAHALAPPKAAVEPSSIAFGTIEIGRDVMQPFELTNDGELAGVPNAGAPSPFSITEAGGAPLGRAELAPGEKRSLELHFRPTAAGMFSADVELALGNGPQAVLRATGGAVPGGTVACLPASIDFGDLARGETASRTSACTVTGGPYTLASIMIAAQPGAPFTISTGAPIGSPIDRFDVTVDIAASGLARRWDGAVELVAAHGPRTMIPLAANVTPPSAGSTDLTVRLVWNTDDTDFDLHLVRDGGSPYSSTHDCYFENKHAEWGQPAVEEDDAFLDRDERSGFGPEEINLARASTVYDVYVQYFDHGGSAAPPTQVAITYWLRGASQMIERQMTTCGNTWHVGTIRFDTGGAPAFSPINAELDTWKSRTPDCR